MEDELKAINLSYETKKETKKQSRKIIKKITDIEIIEGLKRINKEFNNGGIQKRPSKVLAKEMQELLDKDIAETDIEYYRTIEELRKACSNILTIYNCNQKHRQRLVVLNQRLYELGEK